MQWKFCWVVCYTQWIKSSAVIWYTAVSHRDTLMYTLCILNNGLHHMHITGTLKLNYSHFSYTRTMYIRKINVNSASFVGVFLHIKINWQYLSRLTVHTGDVMGICLWIIYFSSSQPFSYFFFFLTNCSQRILKHIRHPFYFIFCR